jgi:Protein of unknown function, DUF481
VLELFRPTRSGESAFSLGELLVSMNGFSCRFFCIVIAALLLPADAFTKDTDTKKPVKHHDNDVVFLTNGDQLTGEIKELQSGILYLKTNFSNSTLQLDWLQVRGLQSEARFEFQDNNENFYVGVIASDPKTVVPEGRIKITLEGDSVVELDLADIIGIHELQRKFRGALNLDLDAGTTFTQGNSQIQTTVQMVLQYSKPRYSWNLSTNSIFSGQSDGTDTSRQALDILGTRTISKSWETIGILDLIHDNQLDLDLRATAGGGFQRIFAKTNRKLLAVYGGLAYTRQDYIEEPVTTQNLGQVFAGLSFSTYQFGGSGVSSYVRVFPSFTDPGNLLVDFSAFWKLQITGNLYWKLSMFNNFNSDPPPDIPENNFGFTSSIGWSF